MKDEEFEREIQRLVIERKIAQKMQEDINEPKTSEYETGKQPKKHEEIDNTVSRKKVLKIAIVLILLAVIINVISISFNNDNEKVYFESIDEKLDLNSQLSQLKTDINNSNDELNDLQNDLVACQKSLEENNSQIISLKSGDEYNLHDPLWDEVIYFLEFYDEIDFEIMLSDFKEQGIRCALVIVGFKDDTCFSLIGFDTLDYGMVYMEPDTGYLVYPEVGLNYNDCVFDQPYGQSLPEYDDEITEILVIW